MTLRQRYAAGGRLHGHRVGQYKLFQLGYTISALITDCGTNDAYSF